MTEQQLYKALQARHSKHGILFRNNTGKAYQGKRAVIKSRPVILEPRLITFGLCVGSSDLIGWTEVIITPEMVGQKVAVFTAEEVKKDNGIISDEQKKFINIVKAAGGIGRVVRYEGGEFKTEEV